MKKNNIIITLILIIIVSIILFIVFGNKNNKVKTSLTKEESVNIIHNIEDNFYSDINNAKKGKYKDYLYCNKVDCRKIDDFNIKEVKYIEALTNENSVYQISYSWSCKTKENCIYNEQYVDNNVSPYYEVNKDNEIVNYLGNIFEQDFNIIKDNFKDAITNQKNGEEVKYLPYNDLEEFNIKTIDYVKTLSNSNFVYKIGYEYKRVGDNSLKEDYSYYEVSNTFNIIKNIGGYNG